MAAAAVDVDFQVFVVDFQVARLVELGDYFDLGETGLAEVIGIERAEPDQAVNAVLAL